MMKNDVHRHYFESNTSDVTTQNIKSVIILESLRVKRDTNKL